MKTLRSIIIISIVVTLGIACNSTNLDIGLTGVINQQGITSYQYGTHTLSNEDNLYALKSSTIELDSFLNKEVTIIGERIEGYPVDGGPLYIEVKHVTPL